MKLLHRGGTSAYTARLRKLCDLHRIVIRLSEKECIVLVENVEQEAVQRIAFQEACLVILHCPLVLGTNETTLKLCLPSCITVRHCT